MYFPLLRARQNELLAIRELLELELLSPKIVPIIEPIKLTSTFLKTLKLFQEKERELIIIVNPGVGSFQEHMKNPKNTEITQEYKTLLDNSLFAKGVYMGEDQQELDKLIEEHQCENIVPFIQNSDQVSIYQHNFYNKNPKYVIFQEDRSIRRKISQENVSSISLTDSFPKKDRNIDYLDDQDNPFSEVHLFYESEGQLGYSDYSIAGSKFMESGFAPMAVAIHIVYMTSDSELRVHHFVSDSNFDIRDIAGKFYEANGKLVEWCDKNNHNNNAIGIFKDHYKRGTFPGLGVIKKLAIMNHLEIIGDYLDNKGGL